MLHENNRVFIGKLSDLCKEMLSLKQNYDICSKKNSFNKYKQNKKWLSL